MKLLVLTSEPISGEQLRETVSDLDGAVGSEVEVMVVAPALQQSGFRFWMSDADDAIARADQVRRETVEQLGEAGVSATGDTGESDPHQAIQDALATFPAERIVVFAHPDSDRRYREDLDLEQIRERFGIPIATATVGS